MITSLQHFARVILLSIPLLVIGCTGEDDHDHDHHHHSDGIQKPSSYPKAVERLEKLHALLLERQDTEDEEHLLEEYEAIVNWIPELAADSDLPKEPWDRIHATSLELHEKLDVILEAGTGRAYRREQADVEPLLDSLITASQDFEVKAKQDSEGE